MIVNSEEEIAMPIRWAPTIVINGVTTSISRVTTLFTPLKTNMSPENQWLEDVFPTRIV